MKVKYFDDIKFKKIRCVTLIFTQIYYVNRCESKYINTCELKYINTYFDLLQHENLSVFVVNNMKNAFLQIKSNIKNVNIKFVQPLCTSSLHFKTLHNYA